LVVVGDGGVGKSVIFYLKLLNFNINL